MKTKECKIDIYFGNKKLSLGKIDGGPDMTVDYFLKHLNKLDEKKKEAFFKFLIENKKNVNLSLGYISTPTLENVSGVGNSSVEGFGSLNSPSINRFLGILKSEGIQLGPQVLRVYNKIKPTIIFREGVDPLFVVNLEDTKSSLHYLHFLYLKSILNLNSEEEIKNLRNGEEYANMSAEEIFSTIFFSKNFEDKFPKLAKKSKELVDNIILKHDTEFDKVFPNLLKDGLISIKSLKQVFKGSKEFSGNEEDYYQWFIDKLYDINSTRSLGNYITIESMDSSNIKLSYFTTKPELEFNELNFDLYPVEDSKIQPVESIYDFIIVRKDGKYYASDSSPLFSQKDLEPYKDKKSFWSSNSLYTLRNRIYKQIKLGHQINSKSPVFLNRLATKIQLNGLEDNVSIETSQTQLKEGQTIVVPNKKLPNIPTSEINNTTYKTMWDVIKNPERAQSELSKAAFTLVRKYIKINSLVKNKFKLSTLYYILNNLKANEVTEENVLNIAKEIDNIEFITYKVKSINDVERTKGDKTVTYKNINLEKIDKVSIVTSKPRSFKTDLASICDKLKKSGLRIELINSSEVKKKTKDKNYETKRAFILDGTIYVNIDNASTGDLFHEFGHLILGYIKQADINEYMKYINLISNSEIFKDRLKLFRSNNDNRAVPDLAEEFLVEQFGLFFENKYNWFTKNGFTKTPDILAEAIFKVFEGTAEFDINKLKEDYTLEEVLMAIGSKLLTQEDNSILLADTMNIRKITNKIKQLINDGVIKEECE